MTFKGEDRDLGILGRKKGSLQKVMVLDRHRVRTNIILSLKFQQEPPSLVVPSISISIGLYYQFISLFYPQKFEYLLLIGLRLYRMAFAAAQLPV